ncbi:unnamed protein product [Rotaria sp. Silwood1]|nr:unnamed protein product [Rotaria sp. Silwood1]
MACGNNDLSDALSKLSIASQQSASNNGIMNFAELVPTSINLDDSFRCQLPFKELIEQRLSQKYFHELLSMMEQKKKIYDFHMRLRNQNQHSFTVDFIYKDVDDRPGPATADVCMSCDMNNKLSELSLIKENSTTRIWLDAQLRKKLIVTPRQHIERLTELSEEDLEHFWQDAQVILDEEGCDWRNNHHGDENLDSPIAKHGLNGVFLRTFIITAMK